MTRSLESAAAVRLLKNAFLAKDVTVTHTEALDIFAQLQGYEAWSHLKAAKRKHRPRKVKPAPALLTFHDIVQNELFKHSESKVSNGFSAYPLSDWQYAVDNGDTRQGYEDWLASELAARHEVHVQDTDPATAVRFVPDHTVAVMAPSGVVAPWHIETDLTDRDGEVNSALLENKMSLVRLLLTEPDTLDELQALMVEDNTFVVCKDGNYGLLIEIEYECAESEGYENAPDESHPVRAVKVERMLRSLKLLSDALPEIAFGIPDQTVCHNERPTAWAFLTKAQVEALGDAKMQSLVCLMDNLACPLDSDAFVRMMDESSAIPIQSV